MSTTVVNLQKAGTGRCVKLRVTGLGGRDYRWELEGLHSREEGTIKGVPEHLTFEDLVGEILYRTCQERGKMFKERGMVGSYGHKIGYDGFGGFQYSDQALRTRIQVLENENKVLKETRIPSSDMGWYNAEFQRLKSERDRLQLELDGAIRARDNYRKALESREKEPVTLTGIRGESVMLTTEPLSGICICPDCGEIGKDLYKVNTPYDGSWIHSVTECQCGATFIYDDAA